MNRGRTGNCILLGIFVACFWLLYFAKPTDAQIDSAKAITMRLSKHKSCVCIYGAIGKKDSVMIGNGIVVDTEGHILTAKHLVRNMTDISVRAYCGEFDYRDYFAQLVDTSSTNDLALLKVTFPTLDSLKCPPCTFADDATVFWEGTDIEIPAYRCTGKGRPILPTGSVLCFTDDMIEISAGVFVEPGLTGSPVMIRYSGIVIGMQAEGLLIIPTRVSINQIRFGLLPVPEKWTVITSPFRAVPVHQIKNYLSNNGIDFQQGHWEWEPQGRSPYKGNPHPSNDHE